MICKKVLGGVEIRKSAVAEALEPNGCQVIVEPGEGNTELALESAVINQYGNQIKRVAMETLEDLDVKDVRIATVDKGVLDYTIRARAEGAMFHAAGQYGNLPWGGAIR